jgi:hypothetical protein
MSKKSRKRNKKILGLLGVLGAGLMASRNKGTAAADVNSGRDGDSSSAIARVKANKPVSTKIVTGTTYPGENEFKETTVNLGKMEGFGPERGVIGQRKRANYATRIRDSQNADMMRAMRSNDAYRGMVPEVDFFSGASAKKGGRIVKTKSGGKALRGYGRAYKGKK